LLPARIEKLRGARRERIDCMTKTLILLRHAKSSWADTVADHDRPLAERGRKAAPVMAKWLSDSGLRPTVALVSTARRTQETWALIAPELGKIVRRDAAGIYEASAWRILDAIHGVEPSVESLLVVGHNPGMEDLARLLIKGDGGEAGARMTRKFPTAAIAVLDIPVEDWTEVAGHTASLTDFVTPKSLTSP
jgi:phosphohistidine phosphatase